MTNQKKVDELTSKIDELYKIRMNLDGDALIMIDEEIRSLCIKRGQERRA